MNSVRLLVLGVVVLVVALTLTGIATAGVHSADMVADPITTAGHVSEDWGVHNDWGEHQHDDDWASHAHHVGHAPHATHGPLGHDSSHAPGSHTGPDGHR